MIRPDKALKAYWQFPLSTWTRGVVWPDVQLVILIIAFFLSLESLDHPSTSLASSGSSDDMEFWDCPVSSQSLFEVLCLQGFTGFCNGFLIRTSQVRILPGVACKPLLVNNLRNHPFSLFCSKRGGKSVGGAYRKIRRQVCKIADTTDLPAGDRQILRFLMSLGRSHIPSRQRRSLLGLLQ